VAKEKPPAFQFYPKDWLSDSNVIAMSRETEGDYIRLLATCWLEGSIPREPRALIKLLKLPTDIDEPYDLDFVEKCFQVDPKDETKLIHKRLKKELKKQKNWRKKSSDGGKKSAKLRKEKALLASTVVEPPLQPNGNTSSSSSSSSSSSKNTHKTDGEKLKEIKEAFNQDWETLPRRDSDKHQALIEYMGTVGGDLKHNRPLFQAKVAEYSRSVKGRENRYIKTGLVFIEQWQGLEIDEPTNNGQPKPNPSGQEWKKQHPAYTHPKEWAKRVKESNDT